MANVPRLTDAQWELIGPLLPLHPIRSDRRGHPWVDDRACADGVLWILKTGARWKDLPAGYPSYATCWRRLHLWSHTGTWDRILAVLLGKLDTDGKLDWRHACVDASFSAAKKGASKSGKPSVARAPSASWSPTGAGFPSVG